MSERAGQREAAAVALLNVVTHAFAWATPPARRLKLWSDVPKSNRPTAFVFEGGTETHENQQSGIGKVTIEARIFVYTDCGNTSVIGATQLNAIADAIDAAMAPVGADVMRGGKNSLSGAAYWARIEGPTLKVPGDLDGDGIMIIPIKITLP